MRKEVTHFEGVPVEWQSQNDYDSHRELIFHIINAVPHGAFYEFGIGDGSTPPLRQWYTEINTLGKEYYSLETNEDWFTKFITKEYFPHIRPFSFVYKNHCLTLTDDYLKYGLTNMGNVIVFIDVAPAEIRKQLIAKFANDAKVIIVHDSEESANYVYDMKEVLACFKYRLDYKPEGKPHTTAVSNIVDVTQ